MITVHHLNNSRSQRILFLLEELGQPYEIVKYERDPKTMLGPPALQTIHPLGKSPVITDDGNTVAESGAIMEYLVEKYGNGKLAPARGTPAFNDYRYFLHYPEGSLMPFLLLRLIFERVKSSKMPFFAKPIARKIADTVAGQFVTPNLERHVKFIDAHLAKQPWFAGDDISAADCMMSYPLEAVAARARDFSTPRIAEWVTKIHARPGFKKALERGGPYDV